MQDLLAGMAKAESLKKGSGGHPLWTLRLVGALLSIFGIFLGYQTLIVIVPLKLADQGASNVTVGLGTGVFMVAAVAAQLSTPTLLGRYRIRSLLVASLLLLGLPSLLQPLVESTTFTISLNVARGLGIGVGSVAGATGVSTLAPAARRGEALGLFGLMTTVPSIVGPVGALTILESSSFTVVFVLLGFVTLLACVSAVLLGSLSTPSSRGRAKAIEVTARPAMLLPFLTFAIVTSVYGAILTFGPLYLVESGRASPPVFLFVVGTTFAVSRFYGGKIVDRTGPSLLLLAGLMGNVLALLVLGSGLFPYATLVAGVIFGSSLGVVSTSIHFRLLTRADEDEGGVANMLFNVAFNAGMGVGGILFGGIAAVTGYSLMFVLSALWVSLAVVLFFADWIGRKRNSSRPG